MNDQLEGIVKVKNVDFKPTDESLKKFIKRNRLYRIGVLNYINESSFADFFALHLFNFELNRYGLTCFTRKNDESLMWAHYADNHKGICFVYDKQILLKNLRVSIGNIESYDIKYGKKPILTLKQDGDKINFESDFQILTTKDINWKYEKETRFIFDNYRPFNGHSLSIGSTPLKAIIYGSKSSQTDREAIYEILSKDLEYEHVKEYMADINVSSGKIEINSL
jgi:hypothetical protein